MELLEHNQKAWDKLARGGIEWSIPVSSEVIAEARNGNWQVFLTESKPVPRDWFPPDLHGVEVLCLASGVVSRRPSLPRLARRLLRLISLLNNSTATAWLQSGKD
ncbi:MAG TPA: hypothetical protein PLL88_07775 [Anaerolineaceae bacterium]|nr:hypothetical protein [Anaerolineaceae bacterium]